MATENICTIIISVLSAIISAIFTAWYTARHSAETFAKKNNKEDVKKAVDLARVYEKELLPLVEAVNIVYRDIPELRKYSEKLNKERQTGNLKFTYTEMKGLFGHSELDEVFKRIEVENISQDLLHKSRNVLNKNYLNDQMFLSSIQENKDDKVNFDRVLNTQLVLEFKYVKGRLLNKLESFSMYFTNGIANESVVYQSLHQTFLSTVMLLYFDIANINTDPKETYYINTIELFKIWNDRFMVKKYEEEVANEIVQDRITEKPMHYKK